MDAEEILEDADIIEVLEKLNITIGPKNKCLCPYHVGYGKSPTPEHDFGSCGIIEKNNWKGIHCFVCGKSWNLVQLVMDKLNCGYIDALKFINGKNVNIKFRTEKKEIGHGRAFAGTSETEGSEIVEYRPIKDYRFSNLKSFTENKTSGNGRIPEMVVFSDEGISFNALPQNVKDYFNSILIDELEKLTTVDVNNKKEFMIRREHLKQLNKIKKELH